MENSCNNVKTVFSKREKQVADLLSRGLSEKEVADKLCIGYDTVNQHTRNIREKFGLHKNTEIILKFISDYTGKPFDLEEIRKHGISVILVLLNVCDLSKLP